MGHDSLYKARQTEGDVYESIHTVEFNFPHLLDLTLEIKELSD